MHKTETYLPQDLIEIYDDTPKCKPNLKRQIISESSEDDGNSHINYETLKALRRKVAVSLSSDGSDYAGTKEDDSNIQNNESGYAMGNHWMEEDREHRKTKVTKEMNQD